MLFGDVFHCNKGKCRIKGGLARQMGLRKVVKVSRGGKGGVILVKRWVAKKTNPNGRNNTKKGERKLILWRRGQVRTSLLSVTCD